MKLFTWALVGFCTIFGGSLKAGASITLEKRVAAQKAIERVYYEHRIWPKENPGPKPPFEEMVPEEVLLRKVEMYLLQSAALDHFWQAPLTGEQLQNELNRMTASSKDPQALEELFDSLDHDAFLIAECLARSILADRLLRNAYAWDDRWHGAVRMEAEALRTSLTPQNFRLNGGDRYFPIHLVVDSGQVQDDCIVSLPKEEFVERISEYPAAGSISPVIETEHAFIIRMTERATEREYLGGVICFNKMELSKWLEQEATPRLSPIISTPNYGYSLSASLVSSARSSSAILPDGWKHLWDIPEKRYNHSAIWTGTEMIVWGGMASTSPVVYWNTGGRYTPITDSWSPVSVNGAPSGRAYHTAVWTGQEMIIWGGYNGSYLRDGNRYNPDMDSGSPNDTPWKTITSTGEPSARRYHSAIWTGNEMIIWGGWDGTSYLNDGAHYWPEWDNWANTGIGSPPSGRYQHTAVWTGEVMIIWGGRGSSGDPDGVYKRTGSRYTPNTQQWTAVSTTSSPSGRYLHSAVWSGTYMIAWGGRNAASYLGDGALYDPNSNTWTATSSISAPTARCQHTAAWTGEQMIVWGGDSATGYTNIGSRYTPPPNESWQETSTTNAPSARALHTAVWSGIEMLIWGGYLNVATNSGSRYRPSTDTWMTIGYTGSPDARDQHTAVWTGNEMIIWGGVGDSGLGLNSGGIYIPSIESWTPSSTSGAVPLQRWKHVAVWTGSSMIVWGGANGSTYYDTGGLLNPGTNSWTVTNPTNAPTPRAYAKAVWSGTQMLAWGGYGCTDSSCSGPLDYLNSGGRYSPAGSGRWYSMNSASAPSGREYHTAVWTGTEMIVWGGWNGVVELNTGGMYKPSDNTWRGTATLNAPAARERHTAVWTGSEMLLWGGYTTAPMADGSRFDPSGTNGTWTAMSAPATPPTGRIYHSAVWTGREMIVWGGLNSTTRLADGIRYNPSLDDGLPGHQPWSDAGLSSNAPSGRYRHTAVWTGKEMIVWDGYPCFQNGGAFYPNTDPIARPFMTILDYQASGNPMTAAYFADHATPFCKGIGASCTSSTLLISRDNIAGTQETNQPNTLLGDGCADGASGTYHLDPSLESLALSAADGKQFFPGRDVTINATAWISDYNLDRLDLYYRENRLDASNEWGVNWRYLGTFAPNGNGSQSFSSTFRLRAGTDQGIRGVLRHQGSPKKCGTGAYDDNDDLFFSVHNVLNTLTYTLGNGEILTLIGSGSYDGASQLIDEPYHDTMDAIALYEWDIDDDAGFPDQCEETSSTGIEQTGEVVSLTETTLAEIAQPGPHTIWLRVTDRAGARDCASMVLTVRDSILPSADVISPDGGESWAYSDSISNRQQHLIVWNAIDNFLPLKQIKLSYSTDAGTTWECLADSLETDCLAHPTCCNQNLSGTDLLEVSDESTDTSFWWAMPTQAETASSQPFPSATARIKVEVWDQSNNRKEAISDANFYIIQPTTTAIKTLILWNSVRIEAKYPGQSAALGSKLAELADHAKVTGVVLDLNAVPAIQSAYDDWDADMAAPPYNQALANAVAAAIRTYVLGQIDGVYTNAQYLQLVGDDYQIPFYRLTDGTFHGESEYPAQGGLNTVTPSTVGSALLQSRVLTDSYYGEYNPEASGISTPADNAFAYLEDFAVGRLVETPVQIAGVINTFLAQDGQLNFTSASDKVLVAGWDFMHDSALAMKAQYAAVPRTATCLLDDPAGTGTTDPCTDKPFTPADLLTQMFASPLHKVETLNTHALHYGYQASTDVGGNGKPLLCTDPTYATGCHATGMNGQGALTATVLYSPGCHAGLTIGNDGPDSTPLDLPEAMAAKGVLAYLGNTGYGWGMDIGGGLSEALMQNLTTELLGHDSIAVGRALAEAKRTYYMQGKRWDVFDEKVLHELTLYGIPNTLIVGKATRGEEKGDGLPPPDGPDKGCDNGICLEKRLTGGGTGLLPTGVTALDLNFTFGPGTYQLVTTGAGSYYKLNGRASGEVGDTIQPHFVYNSYLSGTLAHGVLFTGGAYTSESPFNPVIATPASTGYDPIGEGDIGPSGSTWTPMVRASFGTAGGLGLRATGRAIGQVGYTNLTVHTGFYEGANGGTESRFGDMQFVQYYSTASDVTSPVVQGTGPFHALTGLTAVFTVSVTDASGVYRVLVTYNDRTFGRWRSLDLAYVSGTTWTGSLPLKGSIDYFVQAVDINGNVGILTESGQDLDPLHQPYGSTWSGPKVFSITLPDTDTDSLPDAYEDLHPACLDKATPGQGALDPDYDTLSSYQEFLDGTDPCDGDSDGGGDNDGSEKAHARNAFVGSDDKHLTIFVSKVGSDYQITWPPASGDNAAIDGYYFVYRSALPAFTPADKITTAPYPLPDGAQSYSDTSNPSCNPCFYNVWNILLDTPPPVVQAVAPAVGPVAGGTSVSVFGQNFIPGAKVYFDNVLAANIIFVNVSMLTCATPAHAAGAATVKVITPNAQEGLLPNGFTYQ